MFLAEMSSFRSFVKSAVRPVLLITGAVTATPVALIFCAAIVQLFDSPTRPDANRIVLEDDGPGIEGLVIFLLLLALATFIVASMAALTWHFITRAWRQRELRRLGERFGWTPKVQPRRGESQ